MAALALLVLTWLLGEATPPPARARFDHAVRLLGAGHVEAARGALLDVVRESPSSDEARAATLILAALQAPEPDEGDGLLPARLRAPANPDPVESGRWELILGQTVLAGYYGVSLSLVPEGPTSDRVLWTGVGSALAAAGLTALLTRDFRLHDGYASLHFSLQALGAWHALGILGSAEVDDEDAYLAGGVAAAVAGLGVAVALGERLDIPRGQAELITGADLVGTWTAVAASLLVDPDASEPAQVLIPALAGGDAGIVLGAWAAPRLRWGKWRVRLVELGGLLGAGLAGAGLVTGDADDTRTIVATLYASSIGGGLIAAWLTSGYNTGSDGAGLPVALAPSALRTPGGALTPGLVLGGRF